MGNFPYILKFNTSYQIIQSPDKKYIARTSGSAVYVYDAGTYKEIACFKDLHYANQILFSPNSKILAVKLALKKLLVYDMDSFQLIHSFSIKSSQPQDHNFVFSKDSRFIFNIVYDDNLHSCCEKIDIDEKISEVLFLPNKVVLNDVVLIKEKLYFFGYKRMNTGNIKDNVSKIYILDIIKKTYLEYDSSYTYKQVTYNEYRKEFLFWDKNGTVIVTNNKFVKKIEFQIQKRDGDVIYNLSYSKKGNYVSIAFHNRIEIYDVRKKSIIFQIDAHNGCFVELNDDETLLFVGEWKQGYIYRTKDILKYNKCSES